MNAGERLARMKAERARKPNAAVDVHALRVDVIMLARSHSTNRGFSESLPAKIAALMVKHLGGVDVKLVADTGSAYFHVYGLKVRVADHPRRSRYADVEVQIGHRGDEEGCRYIGEQAASAMRRILDAGAAGVAEWDGVMNRRLKAT